MTKVNRVSVYDIINESFDFLRQEGDMIPFGMGRCACGEFLYPGEQNWDGKDGGVHSAEMDAGGGNITLIECGPVVRSDRGGRDG